MEMYALSLTAQRNVHQGTELENCAAYISANSDAEAIGAGIIAAKKRWPQKDGWYNHNCVTCLIKD